MTNIIFKHISKKNFTKAILHRNNNRHMRGKTDTLEYCCFFDCENLYIKFLDDDNNYLIDDKNKIRIIAEKRDKIEFAISISATRDKMERWFYYNIEKEKFKGYQYLDEPYMQIMFFDYTHQQYLRQVMPCVPCIVIDGLVLYETYEKLFSYLSYKSQSCYSTLSSLLLFKLDKNLFSGRYEITLIFDNYGDFMVIHNKLKFFMNSVYFRHSNPLTETFIKKFDLNCKIKTDGKEKRALEIMQELSNRWRISAYSPGGSMCIKIFNKKFNK